MLYDWMKSIIIYLILSGIVVNLAPTGNYKKYINFFTGLLLLIILAEPVAFLFNIGAGDIDNLLGYIESNMNYEINDISGDKAENYYELSMSDSIELLVEEEGFTASRVEVITDSDYEIIKCTINYEKNIGNNGSLDSEAETLIKNKISDVYNVKVDNIYIVSR